MWTPFLLPNFNPLLLKLQASSSISMAAKKLHDSFSKALIDEVHRWGAMKQTGVTLRYMMEFGSRLTHRNHILAAQFLHKELPIRIARRAIELESLPYGLSEKPAVLKVLLFFRLAFGHLFIEGFDEIKTGSVDTGLDEDAECVNVWLAKRKGFHLVENLEGLVDEVTSAVGGKQGGVEFGGRFESLFDHRVEHVSGVLGLPGSPE
ncbi:hypothetical protein OSB04_029865 [Centaurea solstitialis]|uniref:Protein-serine/threonine kinase n=1 Tax=Centaurea solstitialis TaxID=347529 RepID=A0AA38SPZ9_9ASTR|nr:hypothetical protein OSB04_029865 [Centaurea solstitialis]